MGISMYDNIKANNIIQNDEDIINAIDNSGCNEFISRKINKINEIVSEEAFSNGELICISFARAFVLKPTIYLVDILEQID